MKKIMMLTPALMLENNREKNKEALQYAIENYRMDKIVVYDQEFKDSDYQKGIEYIGHQKERQGFVIPRNKLLEYFYNSDYDYAMFIDANEKVSTTSLNDLDTIVDALKSEKIDCNAILATMGIQISAERMLAKQRKDYFSSVYLLRSKRGYEWLHGFIFKNFKKYYGKPIYIDERCNPKIGICEDIYLPRMIRRIFPIQLCPTIIVAKPPNKTSTWQQDKNNYDYPIIDYPIIDRYIKENYEKNFKDIKPNKIENVVKLDRVKNKNMEYLKPYKSRAK